MGKRAIIFFWLLLLVPTLLIAAGAMRLMRHEQDRIDAMRVTAAREMGGTLADSLQITIAEIKEELLTSLRAAVPGEAAGTLRTWEAENYLVRNVFIWEPRYGLQLPDPRAGTTNEEKRFINRYEALFSGRYGWHAASEGDAVPAPALSAADPTKPETDLQSEQKQSTLVESIAEMQASRRRMVQAAKGAPPAAEVSLAARVIQPAAAGWIPWFEENRLHILGWVRPSSEGAVYGLELELMALLSRLVPEFAALSQTGTVYALIDGSGRILSQSGGTSLKPGDKPEVSVPLAPQLPHWQVAVFFTGPGADASGPSLVLFSSLLLGIFIVAILSGGGLLTWQALRSLKDARQKTSFVSNVSHELKTPLTSIMMYAELLMEKRVVDAAKRDHYLQVIVDESHRLTRLVNNVLDFSRLEQGRKTYNRRRMDLGRYLAETIDLHRVRLQAAAMDIVLQAPIGRHYADIDRDALDQVLLNLIDNAIKYAGEGHYLGVDLSAAKGQLAIRVTDHGPGVPASFEAHLFEKFQRADNSLTTSKPGSGLGLSIARQLIRDQGGDIHCESVPGQGSCFVITLPEKEMTDDN